MQIGLMKVKRRATLGRSIVGRHLPAMALAFSCSHAAACGCDPDSLAFQDAFFTYCDSARAAHGHAAAPREANPRMEPVAGAEGFAGVDVNLSHFPVDLFTRQAVGDLQTDEFERGDHHELFIASAGNGAA